MNDATTQLQLYYDEPYRSELDCTIVNIEPKGSQHIVELDRTIFYPEGGGQPSDQGELTAPAGKLRVEQVRTGPNGNILHQGVLTGQLNSGDQVHALIKWNQRHKNMRVHSAGHLIHDVLMAMTTGLSPTKGNHGQKAFIEYAGAVDPSIKEQLETKVNAVIRQDLPIITRETTYDELTTRCAFVPPGLPRNKQLRILQIGDYGPMPDGGVQVKSTREIGGVVIHSISSVNNDVIIRYGVTHGSE